MIAMRMKLACTSGLVMGLLLLEGCTSSTTGARDAAAGQDGPSQDAATPWLDFGNLLPEVPIDRAGVVRHAPVDLGPFER